MICQPCLVARRKYLDKAGALNYKPWKGNKRLDSQNIRGRAAVNNNSVDQINESLRFPLIAREIENGSSRRGYAGMESPS